MYALVAFSENAVATYVVRFDCPFFQYQRCVLLLPTLNEKVLARPTHTVDLSAKLGGITYGSHELLWNFLAMRHKKLFS